MGLATAMVPLSLVGLLICCLHGQGQILDGTFVDVVMDWQSGQSQNPSLISMPTIDFINDTAVSLVWVLRTTDEVARISTFFDIELSYGLYSNDFINFLHLPTNIPENYSNLTYSSLYTISGLQSASNYQFRICPVFNSGRGDCSQPVVVTTLAKSVNYWEPVLSRRLSLAASGRGFTNPVVQRPHLDTGVEIFAADTSNNPLRFSDPVTSEAPVLPSGRRGHTLSLMDQNVYMFGGRTNGN